MSDESAASNTGKKLPPCYACEGKVLNNHRCAICGRASHQEEIASLQKELDAEKEIARVRLSVMDELEKKLDEAKKEKDRLNGILIALKVLHDMKERT